MKFKLNGERNSGTMFLTELLRLNNFPIHVDSIKKKYISLWKHGVPHSSIKIMDKRVVDIFIFRDLETWLVSMFHNPYHLEPCGTFQDFLTCTQKSSEKLLICAETGEILNADDNEKTIFDIRYSKYAKIMEYTQQHCDVMFVGLSYIQRDPMRFLCELNRKYTLCLNEDKLKPVRRHTKTRIKGEINRKYKIDPDEYRSMIDRYSDDSVEQVITGLSAGIKYWNDMDIEVDYLL